MMKLSDALVGTQGECEENFICLPAGNSEGNPTSNTNTGMGKCVTSVCLICMCGRVCYRMLSDTATSALDRRQCPTSNDGDCDFEHGTCVSDNPLEPLNSEDPAVYCDCDDGWQGDDCSHDVNECNNLSDNACPSNGYCINTDGSYICECCEGFVDDDGVCTDENECQTGSNNCDSNAECNDGSSLTCDAETGEVTGIKFTCTCADGYLGDGTQCFENGIGGDCTSDTDCFGSGDGSVVCDDDDGKCRCADEYVEEQGTCYEGGDLDDNCPSTVRCLGPHVYCNDMQVCACENGYEKNGDECVNAPLGYDEDCTGVDHLCDNKFQCDSGTNKCACSTNFEYVLNLDDCFGTKIGQRCATSDDTCSETNQECSSSICQCKAGYIFINDECRDLTPGYNEDCSDLTYCEEPFVCLDTGLCGCDPPSTYSNNDCYSATLGGKCQDDSDCMTNGECDDEICICPPQYSYNTDTEVCDELDVGSFGNDCDVFDCSEPNTVCGDSDTCECTSGSTRANEKCESLIGIECDGTTPCHDTDATCVTTGAISVCECNSGFVPDASYDCTSQVSNGISCVSSIDNICADDHAECTGTCTCVSPYEVDDMNDCILPAYDTTCSVEGAACNPESSTVCDGSKCVCRLGFHYDSGTTSCVADADYSDGCTSSSDCSCGLVCDQDACSCPGDLTYDGTACIDGSTITNNYGVACVQGANSCIPTDILKCIGNGSGGGKSCYCSQGRTWVFNTGTLTCSEPVK